MHRVARKKSRPAGQTQPKSPHQQLIVSRAIAELTLNEHNPRVHSPRQIRQLADSIKTFGFNGAALIDREGRVIAGHAHILACQQLGWTEVPTIGLDHLSADQARAFMIADNRLTEISTWNERLLAETLRELSVVDFDFSL
jgi:ParB-like chromosome segregation protein Spo0J